MTDTEPLKGKVLKILDPYRIVVNIGYDQGIKRGMEFIIYELGEDILDPDTGKVLDKLEIIKHRLIVTQVQEKFSIMKSDEYEAAESFAAIISGVSNQKRLVPLFTEEKPQKLSENEYKKIKVGDFVRQDLT
ncbi:MAG: hypothetical protein WC367_00980 [Methanoregula sp.]|jgi:hypothetical protein